ncbi:MAG TPA: DinB family protein [Gemmatimonadaceae bacterium]
MQEYFKRMFAHLQWADARTLRSIVDSQHLPAHALELFAHLVAAEHVWLSRMAGVPPRVPVWPTLSIAECDALMNENHAAYAQFLDELGDDDLAHAVTYRNSAGREFTSTVEEMLTQVAMHGSYHRGQIAALVRAAGDEPQPTDYIAFTRGAPSATRGSGQG